MKNSLILGFLLIFFSSFAQETDSVKWVKLHELPIGSEEIWSVDVLGNVYITANKTIEKFDSVGVKKFSQSIKSLGRLKQIEPINTMKVLTFSEEQQMICVLDNTLTLSENCIELNDFDIGNATMIAASGQPDKVWVVDQLNSKLILLSLGGTNQFQEIKNLRGILNITAIVSIKEVENQLYLASSDGKIYLFDLYGSLLNVHDLHAFTSFFVKNDALIGLNGKQLTIHKIEDAMQTTFDLPIDGVEEIALTGNFFYFRTENKILKFTLSLNN